MANLREELVVTAAEMSKLLKNIGERTEEMQKKLEKCTKILDRMEMRVEEKKSEKDAVSEKKDEKKPVEQETEGVMEVEGGGGAKESSAEQQLNSSPFSQKEKLEGAFVDNPKEDMKVSKHVESQVWDAVKTMPKIPIDVQQAYAAAEETKEEMKRAWNVEKAPAQHWKNYGHGSIWVKAEDDDGKEAQEETYGADKRSQRLLGQSLQSVEKENEQGREKNKWVLDRVGQISWGRSPKFDKRIKIDGPVCNIREAQMHIGWGRHPQFDEKINIDGPVNISKAQMSIQFFNPRDTSTKLLAKTHHQRIARESLFNTASTHQEKLSYLFDVDTARNGGYKVVLYHDWVPSATVSARPTYLLKGLGLFRENFWVIEIFEDTCWREHIPLQFSRRGKATVSKPRASSILSKYKKMLRTNYWAFSFEHIEALTRLQVNMCNYILFVCFFMVEITHLLEVRGKGAKFSLISSTNSATRGQMEATIGTRRLFWLSSRDQQNRQIRALALRLMTETEDNKGRILEKERVASLLGAISILLHLDAVTTHSKARMAATREFQGRENFLGAESLISVLKTWPPAYESENFPDLQQTFVWQHVILFTWEEGSRGENYPGKSHISALVFKHEAEHYSLVEQKGSGGAIKGIYLGHTTPSSNILHFATTKRVNSAEKGMKCCNINNITVLGGPNSSMVFCVPSSQRIQSPYKYSFIEEPYNGEISARVVSQQWQPDIPLARDSSSTQEKLSCLGGNHHCLLLILTMRTR